MAYSASSQYSGQKVINKFLQKYVIYNGTSISQADLMKAIVSYDPNIFLKIIGTQYETLGQDESKLDDAMDTLASSTRGRLPTTAGFTQALSGQVDGFATVLWNATKDTGDTLVKGAVAVGDSAILTGKVLVILLPILVVGAIFYLGKDKLDKIKSNI